MLPSVSWESILEQWDVLVYDFQRILHVDLEWAWTARSWRWFDIMVGGLLSTSESLLRITVRPPPAEVNPVRDSTSWVLEHIPTA